MTIRQARTYEEALAELDSLPAMPEEAPSLAPMQEGLRRIGFEEYGFDPGSVIVVAGTNGKGSVCATLEKLLCSTGARVGLYTSPHLVEYTERFRLNGADVPRSLFLKAYQRVNQMCSELKLSHFEILTLMAAWVFCSGEGTGQVDWLVLEVGLGGTWDATNAIPHKNCIITPIGMDHENLLGGTIEKIAANKFGIVGSDSRVVHAHLSPDLDRMAAEVRSHTGSRWVEVMPHHCKPISAKFAGEEPRFLLECPLGETEIALPGKRGAENTAIALTAFQELGFDAASHLDCLKQVQWPGRMERIQVKLPANCAVYLSGDHNPPGVRSLIELLPHYPRARLHVLVGIAQDKNIEEILQQLFEIPASSIYLTRNPVRGGELSEYGEWREKARGAWENPEDAFRNVLAQARSDDMVLVTGSLYLIGHIKKLFES